MKPEPIYKQIGGTIRALRRRADQAQEALAAQLGISRATLANIETGRQRILVHQLYSIAQVLGVKVGDMLPSPPEDLVAVNWTSLSFEGDLNAEQKKQVANLIGPMGPAAPRRMEGANAKASATRNTRGSRSKTAR